MPTFGFTGPRALTPEQAIQASYDLYEIDTHNEGATWHVGDADGVDKLARENCREGSLTEHNAEGRKPWQLQARSKRLVEALAQAGGTLHAWPNKPAPADLKPDSWQGSGTWGTILYAHTLGVQVVLHPLADFPAPVWLSQEQMSLL